MEIVYLGKPFSFTHIVAQKRFGKKCKFIAKPTISQTIEYAIENFNSLAVVPIENTHGIIEETVDFLSTESFLSSGLTVKEQLELSIQLYLLSKYKIKLSEVRKIYSHEYALKNSHKWINKNLASDVKLFHVNSTSEAASHLKKEKGSVAIASLEAGKYYNLKILEKISKKLGEKKNITRFFVIGYKKNETL